MKCWKCGRTGHWRRECWNAERKEKLVTTTQAQELVNERRASACREKENYRSHEDHDRRECDKVVHHYQQDDGFRKRFEFGRGSGRRGGRGQGGLGYDDRIFQRDKGGAPRKDRPYRRGPHEGGRVGTRELRATSKQDNTLIERKAKDTPESTPEYNLSKVSKGEDLSPCEKKHTLRKKKEEEVDKEEECKNIEIPQRVGKQWDVLDIDIQYKDSGTGRGGHERGCGGFKDNQDRPPIVQPWEREYVCSISPKEILSRHKTADRCGFSST
ncbi:hypothetical protein GE061_008395 [Apolygus lucorum]|uniref:CCHC-type domain-containing protein n=1 Tax=Apolygus lucorum TaxID=248454 RepID=A0A8S9WPS0_APOLU|nr:hypothetical protein GE061_008395 [Apolygus lucorum]